MYFLELNISYSVVNTDCIKRCVKLHFETPLLLLVKLKYKTSVKLHFENPLLLLVKLKYTQMH